MMIEIRHLEWITVTADGRKVLGYNQEWYPEKRQKLAGCGPTVGAMIAAYVEMKEWQMPVTTKEGATSKMLDIWKYANSPHARPVQDKMAQGRPGSIHEGKRTQGYT